MNSPEEILTDIKPKLKEVKLRAERYYRRIAQLPEDYDNLCEVCGLQEPAELYACLWRCEDCIDKYDRNKNSPNPEVDKFQQILAQAIKDHDDRTRKR